MAKPAADIDKDWAFGIPAANFSFERVNGEPSRHSLALLHHILLEICKPFRILLKPDKGWHINVPGWLEDTFGVIGDRLVFGFGQKLR